MFKGNIEYGRKESESFIALHIKSLHALGGSNIQMFTECLSSML